MELIPWAFNAVDKIISTRHTGREEPTCPGGTFPAGYVMDPWNRWRVLCLSVLSMEDVEDVYLLVLMITVLMAIAAASGIIYWKIGKMTAVIQKEVTDRVGGVIQQMMMEKLCKMMKEIDERMIAGLVNIHESMAAKMVASTGRIEMLLKSEMQIFKELSHNNMELCVEKISKRVKELEEKWEE